MPIAIRRGMNSLNLTFLTMENTHCSSKCTIATTYDIFECSNDQLGRRDFLGQTRIDFPGMADQEEQDLWLPLVNKKGEPMQSGKVHVHLTYLQKADKF